MRVNLKFSLLTASFNQPLHHVQTYTGLKSPKNKRGEFHYMVKTTFYQYVM